MYPKHTEIKDIQNSSLREALYTAEDDELRALQKAFPECYSESLEDFQIPASLLRRMAEEEAGTLFDPHEKREIESWIETNWSSALHKLEVPRAFTWGEDVEESVPEEVMDQLTGKVPRGGMPITHQGKDYYLVGFVCVSGKSEREAVERRETIAVLSVVDTRFIDLNS